jgi:hypothetical protein
MSWIRNTAKDTVQPPYRVHVKYQKEKNDWVLQIKFAKQRDAGLYECQVQIDTLKEQQQKYAFLPFTSPTFGAFGVLKFFYNFCKDFSSLTAGHDFAHIFQCWACSEASIRHTITFLEATW